MSVKLDNREQSRSRVQDVRAAARDTVPVAMGYLPLGSAYGILLTHSGIPWYWAPISCLLVFAGSMQFLSVSLLSTAAALPQVALATLAVNFRHVFYGLSFPLDRIRSRPARAYGVFALTDETYSLVAARADGELSGRRITYIQLLSHAYWTGSCTLGALAAYALPAGLKGLDFALTALFVVLAQESIYRQRNLLSVVMGLSASLITAPLMRDNFLAMAIGIFFVMLIVSYLTQRRSRG
ncbi:AzlC family ABC transporter permease [Microbispora sp. RL4-1S]|uniref:AzlC family ABC transporter permease n=1 Tax=Microbispora oryzae TaxID=2806554 RepID=A0A941ARD1_9ACTN|nr:AzlC family ABC transporter permease [Microbispora oryzae]MBP2705869.1 AzlC family ABC transporter permease [Microbispora oryzae]